jgi:hypothetical protein
VGRTYSEASVRQQLDELPSTLKSRGFVHA